MRTKVNFAGKNENIFVKSQSETNVNYGAKWKISEETTGIEIGCPIRVVPEIGTPFYFSDISCLNAASSGKSQGNSPKRDLNLDFMRSFR